MMTELRVGERGAREKERPTPWWFVKPEQLVQNPWLSLRHITTSFTHLLELSDWTQGLCAKRGQEREKQ